MNVNQFNNTKHNILQKKEEFLLIQLDECQRRKTTLKATNQQLKLKIKQLKKYTSSAHLNKQNQPNSQQQTLQNEKKLQQLKARISEMKKMCEQTSLNNSVTRRDRKTMSVSTINLSTSRTHHNNLITKVKCHGCEEQFKPNQYYNHVDGCVHLKKAQLMEEKTLIDLEIDKLV